MQHGGLKTIQVLMAAFLLALLHGCSHTRSKSTYQTVNALINHGRHAEGQSALVEESTDQARGTNRNESGPRRPGSIIGPGDEIQIDVYEHADLSQEVYIDPSGKMMYPLIGDIHAAGLNTFQLRDRICDRLEKYIVDPQVTVRVVSFRSQKIVVLGEVGSPGSLQADVPISALEVISRSGGFSIDAEQKNVLIIRGGMNDPELKVLNLKKALKQGVLTHNIMLHAGDIVYVPNTTISNVTRFFGHLSSIISPILSAETAVLVGRQIKRDTDPNTGVAVSP